MLSVYRYTRLKHINPIHTRGFYKVILRQGFNIDFGISIVGVLEQEAPIRFDNARGGPAGRLVCPFGSEADNEGGGVGFKLPLNAQSAFDLNPARSGQRDAIDVVITHFQGLVAHALIRPPLKYGVEVVRTRSEVVKFEGELRHSVNNAGLHRSEERRVGKEC